MIRIFTSDTQKIGKLGEDIARIYLEKRGYVTRETNFNTRFGELDIISEKDGEIYFVEVKTVSRETLQNKEYYDPQYNFSTFKLRKMQKSAEIYMDRKYVTRETPVHTCLISVFLSSESKAYVKFEKNMF